MDKLFALFARIEKEKPPVEPVSMIVAGLGNPGPQYRFTRHNAGFLALSYMAQKLNAEVNRSKFGALCGEATLGGRRCLLLLPQTFMNNSGEAVGEAMRFYKLSPADLLVVYDDVALAPGRLRIRPCGSAGGHNGMKSIIEHVGSEDFPRIRIGVGEKPHPEMDLADWVLSSFSDDEQKLLFDKFESVLSAAGLIAAGDVGKAMNLYNG